MKRVVIESPYAGDIETNLRYLRACMHDCFTRGEAPFASHGLYTQPGVLRDEVAEERELGIQGGFAWRDAAEMTVVYTDLGMSSGMKYGIADAEKKGRPIEYRQLDPDWIHAKNGALGTANWGLIGMTSPIGKAPPPTKRFFRVEDDGSHWSVVARDEEHCKQILREQGAEWEALAADSSVTEGRYLSLDIDGALEHGVVQIREYKSDEVASKLRCHTDDERGIIPLAAAELGEAFCSEW